jgi:succinate-semialdehyde dehydrogenase/glutarate-semialdehyde dehydrogenase
MVNDVVSCFGISEAPHGGVKSSGIGRTHGSFGLEEMVRVKHIDLDRLPSTKKVWWYGYGDRFMRQMEGFIDLMFSPRIIERARGGLRAMKAVTRKDRV